MTIFRRFMDEEGITIDKVCEVAKVGYSTVYSWRGGRRDCPFWVPALIQLRKALNNDMVFFAIMNNPYKLPDTIGAKKVEAVTAPRHSAESIASYRAANPWLQVDDKTICDLIDYDNGKITIA